MLFGAVKLNAVTAPVAVATGAATILPLLVTAKILVLSAPFLHTNVLVAPPAKTFNCPVSELETPALKVALPLVLLKFKAKLELFVTNNKS